MTFLLEKTESQIRLFQIHCLFCGKNKPEAVLGSISCMWRKILRLTFGILLLPLCAAVTGALLDVLRDLPPTPGLASPQTLALTGGYFTWLLLYLTVLRPMRAYIWAHELTHALWGLCFGASIHDIRVHEGGGAVALSKTNVWIALAPYFFPFYTMVVIGIHALLGIWYPMARWEMVWLFLVGLTWGFHFTFTVQTLLVRQPDLIDHGRLFSLALIYLLNLAGIGIWVVCTTPATWGELGGHLLSRAATCYAWVWSQISDLVSTLIGSLSS